ncbi:hypothetical protein Btru_010752 [Bulinus truncatus]|nr:hypothetical protein Btru_010752 [Bulinus truncatus]
MESASRSDESKLRNDSKEMLQMKNLEYHQRVSLERDETIPQEYALCLTVSPRKKVHSASYNGTVETHDAVKRKHEDAENEDVVEDVSDHMAAEDRHGELVPPVKKSRAKKMQGLTFEQAEMRRSRTNEQERERQRNISEAMEALRRCDMPFNPYLNHKEESKIYLLKTATAYIYGLVRMIDDHDRGLVHHCDHRVPQQPRDVIHSGVGVMAAPQFTAYGYYDTQSESVSLNSLMDCSPSMHHYGLHTSNNQRPPAAAAAALVEELSSQNDQEPNFRNSQHEHSEEHFQNFVRPIDSPITRFSNATFVPSELQTDATDHQLIQQNSRHPPFSNHPASYTPEYKNDHRPVTFIPAPVSPYHPLSESPLQHNLPGSFGGLLFGGVLKGGGITGDPTLHSTPIHSSSNSTGDQHRQTLLEKSAASSLVCARNNINSSANSSGYQSMVSAACDDDSKSFSPDRLHQTIDEMYSDTFLAPSPTKRINFDAF